MPQAASLGATGTLMQKPIPPRLVEPYLTGRRAVIAGFVYRAADTAERGGDWSGKPPFTGTGYTSWPSRPIPEFFVDLMPIPVGAEIYRIARGHADFIARYDGQVWLRPAEGV